MKHSFRVVLILFILALAVFALPRIVSAQTAGQCTQQADNTLKCDDGCIKADGTVACQIYDANGSAIRVKPFRAPPPAPLWLGMAVLGGIMLGFAAVGWWLYLSPIKETVPAIDLSERAIRTRRMIGGLVCVAGLSLCVALVWDELMHRLLGGFGDDFLWPPHLMMYGSFLLDFVFAAVGLSITFRRNTGSIRRRFRAEPAMSLLALVSIYEVASLPSDQIWHGIYGVDITAWSLPHLFIFGTAAVMFLMACALLLSGTRDMSWQPFRSFKRSDAPLILLVAMATWLALLLGTVEYEWRTDPLVAHQVFDGALGGRPSWAYPVVVLLIGVFMAHFALHVVRKPGAATLAAMLVMIGRVLHILTATSAIPPGPGLVSHGALVIPAIALDLWYAYRLRNADSRLTLFGGIGIYLIPFGLIVLPYINQMQIGPLMNVGEMVNSLIIGGVLALFFAPAASTLGDWVRGMDAKAPRAVVPSGGMVSGVASTGDR